MRRRRPTAGRGWRPSSARTSGERLRCGCAARVVLQRTDLLGEAERGDHRLEGEELEDGADRVVLVREVALGDAQRFPQPPVPAVEDEEVLPATARPSSRQRKSFSRATNSAAATPERA